MHQLYMQTDYNTATHKMENDIKKLVPWYKENEIFVNAYKTIFALEAH